MAIVARLLPRHWDGRRLLQFLTGLALIALAFAVPSLQEPADQPFESPVAVITTVDARLPAGLPLAEIPATPATSSNKTNLALAPESLGTERSTGTNPAAGMRSAAGAAAQGAHAAAQRAQAGGPAAAQAGGPAAAQAGKQAAQAGASGKHVAQAGAFGKHVAQAGAFGTQAAGPGAAGTQSSGPDATHEATGLPAQAWHGGRRACFERRAAGAGAAQRAHGERAPPGV